MFWFRLPEDPPVHLRVPGDDGAGLLPPSRAASYRQHRQAEDHEDVRDGDLVLRLRVGRVTSSVRHQI